MTVVDIHSHLFAEDLLPDAWWESIVDIIVRDREKSGRPIDRATVWEKYLPTFMDPDGEKLIQRLDETGIDRQVVFPVDWGLGLGDPPIGIEAYNQRIAELQDRDDRIVGFAAVDPRRPNAVELVERAFDEWGLQGLKLHPTAGFHLHDGETYRVLDVAARRDLPVLTDSGPIGAPLYSKYSDPRHVDEVLTEYPDLDLIVAHMSLGWWRDLLAIAEMKRATHLRVDLSGWQERVEDKPVEFARAVRGFIDALGADRVHWGTDDPVFDPVYPKEEWIEYVRGLVEREERPTFTDEEITQVLGGGALALLD